MKQKATDSPVVGLLKSLQAPVAEHIDKIIRFSAREMPSMIKEEAELMPFFKQLRYKSPEISRRISVAGSICALDRDSLTTFLGYFPTVSTNMSVPALSDKALEQSVFAKVTDFSRNLFRRMTMAYLGHEMLCEFFLSLLATFEDKKLDNAGLALYKAEYQQVLLMFLLDTDKEYGRNLKAIFWRKWALIFNKMSRVVPENVLADFFKLMQEPFNQKKELQVFVFKAFSEIHYPEFTEARCQFLIKLLGGLNITSKSDVHYILAAMKFVRNLLGFALANNASGLANEIKKFISRIPRFNEKLCFTSTLVLYHTLGNQTDDIRQMYDGSASKYKTRGVLRALCSVLNGSHYLPDCEINATVVRDWRPRDCDVPMIANLFKFVIENKKKFTECQEELGQFFIRCFLYDPNWFLKECFNPKFADSDFSSRNIQAIFSFAEYVFSEKHFVEFVTGNRILKEHEMEFVANIQTLAQSVFDANKVNSNGSSSYLIYDCEDDSSIVEGTVVVPAPLDGIATDIDIEAWQTIDPNIEIPMTTPWVLEGEIPSPCKPPDYEITALKRAIPLFPSFPPSEQLMNMIVLYLFSSDPLISAITLRALEKYITLRSNYNALDAVLTLIPKTVTEWHLMTYATYRLVKTVKSVGLALDYQHACTIFTWTLLFLASPCPGTRHLALELSSVTKEIIGDNASFPNLGLFLEQTNTGIARRAIYNFVAMNSMEKVPDIKQFIGFEIVAMSISQEIYYVFFSAMLSFLTYYIGNFVDLRDLVNGQTISLIYANTGWSGPRMIFLITIHVAVCGSDSTTMETILASGLKAAIDSGPLFFQTLFSSLNPQLPCNTAKQLLIAKEANHARALAFSLRIRMTLKDCEQEIGEFESVLKRLVDYLIDSHVISESCDMTFDMGSLDRDWGFAISNLMMCVESFQQSLFVRHSEQRRGTFLRKAAVGKNLRNPFDTPRWFAFLYNMLGVSPVQYPLLSERVISTFAVYMKVVKIPKPFKVQVKDSIMGVVNVKLADHILSSSLEYFLSWFIEQAVALPTFFVAICNQFLDPIDFESDLTKLKRILQKGKSHQTFLSNLGSLAALALYYITAESFPTRQLSFKLLYHITMFAFIASNQVPFSAIEHLDEVRSRYLSSCCEIPSDLLLKISSDFCMYFPFAVDQFVDQTFNILSLVEPSGPFLALLAPWFSVVDCNDSVLSKLEMLVCRRACQNRDATRFQIPVQCLPLVDAFVEQRPRYIVNRLLSSSRKPSIYLCLYICLQYDHIILPLLVEHLKFDYWVHEKMNYRLSVRTVMLIFDILITESYLLVQPYLHYIYFYCYCHSELEKVAADILERIDVNEFSAEQREAIACEALRWTTGCGNAQIALRACMLLRQFDKRPSESKCRVLLNTISCITNILPESKAQVVVNEILLMASLLDMAYFFNPLDERLHSYVVEFLKCNKAHLGHIFVAAIDVFNSLWKAGKVWSHDVVGEVFISLLTAECLNVVTLEKVIDTLISIAEHGSALSDINLLKAALCPPLLVDKTRQSSIFADTEREALTTSPSTFIQEKLSCLKPESLYFVLSFYVMLATTDPFSYKNIISETCCNILKTFLRVSPVTTGVFQPLTSLIISSEEITDTDVQLLKLLARRPKPRPVELPAGLVFPSLHIELQINEIPWLPTDRQFVSNHVYSILERKLSGLPTPPFIRTKESLSHTTYTKPPDSLPFSYTDILIRIDMFLTKRKAEKSRKKVSKSSVFSFQPVSLSVFTPSLEEANKIGDPSHIFPPLGA